MVFGWTMPKWKISHFSFLLHTVEHQGAKTQKTKTKKKGSMNHILWRLQLIFSGHVFVAVACIAGGIVSAREIKFWRRSRQASSEAARRMGRGTLKYRLPENLSFLNAAQFYHLIDLNWSQLNQPIRTDNFCAKYRRKGSCCCCMNGKCPLGNIWGII